MPHPRTARFVRFLALPPLFLAGALSLSSQEEEPLLLGEGRHTYEWVRDWAKLPDGMSLGNTHGCVVVDSRDRVYLNTDTENAVVVFDADGNFLSAWGAELAGGLHGMAVVGQGEDEALLLAHTGRHQVLKASLEGEIQWTVGYPEESGIYESESQYRPTSVAPHPDGGFFVADGYGASWIHRYDAEGTYVSSFGGPGEERGKLRTPHGIRLETRGDAPVLSVSDRENGRLQTFTLGGEAVDALEDVLRRPCHTHTFETATVVADLAGRITILDEAGPGEADDLVLHLGDNPDPAKRANNGVPAADWRDGEFLAPHCADWDSEGNLYVTDWVAPGRVTKLARVR